MSIQWASWVWKNGPQDSELRFTLLALADRADEQGVCWPSVAEIAGRVRCSERAAQYRLKRLEAGGWLLRDGKGGRGKSVLYTILKGATDCTVLPIERVQTIAPIKSLKGATQRSKRVQPETLKGATCDIPPHPLLGEPSGTVIEPPATVKGKITAEEIYKAYPRRVGHGAAITKIKLAMQKHDHAMLLAQTVAYAKKRTGEDSQFTPHPATWFFQERFLDEELSPQPRFVETTWEETGIVFDRERNGWVDREGKLV